MQKEQKLDVQHPKQNIKVQFLSVRAQRAHFFQFYYAASRERKRCAPSGAHSTRDERERVATERIEGGHGDNERSEGGNVRAQRGR